MNRLRSAKRVAAVVLCFAMLLACMVQAVGVTSGPTPVSAETTRVKWSVRFGTSYRDAPSVPADADGYLAVMMGKRLLKVSTADGSIVSEAGMSASPGLGYVAPTFQDGIVYCPLLGAVVEAFDFSSMTKLWSYTDALGGQSLTSVVYSDGLVFTGFWNNDDETAAYVCLDALTGELKWRIERGGGFYWAACAPIGDYVVFGGDDGTVYDDRQSEILAVKKSTGEISDSKTVTGDVRSAVTYNDANGRVYFVTKAGYLYSASFRDGKLSDLKEMYLGGASTATPVIYNGRVYVGVQSSARQGKIAVIDSETLHIIYTADMPGYPQNCVLLSSFYGDTAYIYTTYNAPPGGIMMMTDAAGQTVPSVSALFTPSDSQVNYSISPIIADSDGTLYYKNDSGYIFALENTSETDAARGILEKLYRLLLTILRFFNNIFI